ncbi:hypothetical protein CUU66_06420 [Peribacillus deserti]|uniref:Uncharacterized protein n=1 Tax=Peribacillus deserti TaxID=673318 RepID=A0A2N5M8X2_9BACI|nr:hypothetical protein CUU66_06420 [Peribacillus deserti]
MHKWYNRKHEVPHVFAWFPKRFGVRKVSQHLSQLNNELEAQGKGIWVTIYAIDLYIITIPLRVSKYK